MQGTRYFHRFYIFWSCPIIKIINTSTILKESVLITVLYFLERSFIRFIEHLYIGCFQTQVQYCRLIFQVANSEGYFLKYLTSIASPSSCYAFKTNEEQVTQNCSSSPLTTIITGYSSKPTYLILSNIRACHSKLLFFVPQYNYHWLFFKTNLSYPIPFCCFYMPLSHDNFWK